MDSDVGGVGFPIPITFDLDGEVEKINFVVINLRSKLYRSVEAIDEGEEVVDESSGDVPDAQDVIDITIPKMDMGEEGVATLE